MQQTIITPDHYSPDDIQATFKRHDAVTLTETGAPGEVCGLAQLQFGREITAENPLYLVYFERLGLMKRMVVKISQNHLTARKAGQ